MIDTLYNYRHCDIHSAEFSDEFINGFSTFIVGLDILAYLIKYLQILMCIADDTKWLFFRIVPPPSAGEQYTTKLGFICQDNTYNVCCGRI